MCSSAAPQRHRRPRRRAAGIVVTGSALLLAGPASLVLAGAAVLPLLLTAGIEPVQTPDGTASTAAAVIDTTPPAITVPAPQTTDATGADGASVSFPAASAIDVVDGPITPTCSAGSGSIFAIGTNTVACSATDHAGNTTTGTFTVHVTDASEQLMALQTAVAAVSPSGILASRVASAQEAVSGQSSGAAISALRAFLDRVQALAGGQLTTEQAASYTTAANRIITVLGG